ncbi:MAG TPA: hypothetical protein VLS53_04825 [Candidatus Dormibacteraeota bacterium]|nr:hypothetical protein [Candidatus Dormibacteraeota bacterium]
MNRTVTTSISYLGKRTGLPRTCRAPSARLGDDFVLRVRHPEELRWWRNFLSPWPVTVVQPGRMIHGTGHVVSGESEEGRQLSTAYFSRYRNSRPRAVPKAQETLTFVRVMPR